MQLTFDSSDRENFRVRGPDGALLYVAHTPNAKKNILSSNCIILSRPLVPSQSNNGSVETEVIAKVRFRTFGVDEIEFLGSNFSAGTLFPKKGWPNR